MSSHRTRYACASCTRRKVKCSKTTPCSNCIRRGEHDTCSSDVFSPRPVSSHQSNTILSPPASVTGMREVDSLRSRVDELEAQLRRENTNGTDRHDALDLRATTASPVGASRSIQTTESADTVAKDAASILEFLAWGRKVNNDYNLQLSPEASANTGPDCGDICDAPPNSAFPDVLEDTSQIAHLQLLLPSKKQVWELVLYHEECLMWYHCSYYAPSFRRQMEVFYDRFQGTVHNRGVNIQWLALLFAVLTGSITCAPHHIAQSWGFRPAERENLSRRWCRAVYTCLNAADYASKQSILSVQAISTLTHCAHILGFSNMHSIHLAAVIRVAQGLGLHRITDDSPGTLVEKECGRRLWGHLCSQDWFSIPFSDTYLINPLYSQSTPPANCHDEEMELLPETVPTITTYCRLLIRIASIMPQLQDDLVSCNTPFTKYEQIVKWDRRMRALSTAERPAFLSNTPLDPLWPVYIPWARRSLAVTSAHKIIMIHRSFLSESFTNPAFSFTRRTCLAAAKTIIKEVKIAMDENEPNFWIYQAFSVAASIILILDILHRSPAETEYSEHRQLAEDVLLLLRQCQNSMIALRGVKLLSALLEEISIVTQNFNGRKRRRGDEHLAEPGTTRQHFNVLAFVKSFSSGRKRTKIDKAASQNEVQVDPVPQFCTGEVDPELLIGDSRQVIMDPLGLLSSQHSDMDMSFMSQGLGNATPFENLLYLANHDFDFMGA